MNNNCVKCHQAGGVAPFALTSYSSAAFYAGQIKYAVTNRIMPPPSPVNDGSCQSWKDSRYLSNADIQTLSAWADAGAPEGDTSIPLPAVSALPQLANPNVVARIPAAYTAKRTSGIDDYRCFSASVSLTGALDLSSSVFITGFQVNPGNAQIVHHVLLWATTDGAAAVDGAIAAKEAEDAEPGWKCFGGSGLNTGLQTLAIWAPGTGATQYPSGTGIPVRPDARIIIQVHYSLQNATMASDPGTSVNLRAESASAGLKNASWLSVGNTNLNIPPGQASFPTSRTDSLSALAGVGQGAGTIYGVYPHMHTAGRKISLARNSNQCMLNLPNWSFNWQGAYFYGTPINVSTSDQFTVSCEYDTVSRSQSTVYGEETANEMCYTFLYATSN